MTSPVSRYHKPFTSVPEQVRLLAGRGLGISDADAAAAILRQIGYYRLSGYSHFFRRRDADGTALEEFRPGATLGQVVALHEADANLRHIMLRGLAVLEVALRFHIGHRLGRRAAFAHRLPDHLGDEFRIWRAGAGRAEFVVSRSRHHEWLRDYSNQERRAQDRFVSHFRRKYGPHLPVWASTEVMSLGTLTRLYEGMREKDQKLIAARFGALSPTGDGDSALLSNWLNHMRHVRNIAAHHGRFWNRTLDVALSVPTTIPELAHLQEPAPRKVYGSAAVLRFLLARIDPGSQWHEAVRDSLLELRGRSGVEDRHFGATSTWQNEQLWTGLSAPDMDLIRTADLIDEVDVLNVPEARAIFVTRARPSEKKSWLRYLTSKQALIALRLGPQTYYPAFQFRGTEVDPVVAEVNEMLFHRLSAPGSGPAQPADVLRWWLEPTQKSTAGASRLDRIAADPDGVRFEAAAAQRP